MVDILGAYLSEAGSYVLLSAEDEVELFGYIEKGLAVYQSLESLDNLTEEQRVALIKLASAQQVIFHTNLRLVISIAKPYWQRANAMPAIDLIQEGNAGLSRAIAGFDIGRGLKFSTFATWWVRQAITHSIGDKSRLIRLPAYMHGKYQKAIVKTIKLSNELERDLTDEEIEKATGMPVADYHELMRRGATNLLSMNALIGDSDADTELGDYIADQNSDMDQEIEDFSNREELKTILNESSLTDREKFIVGLRNGIDPEVLGPLSLELKGGRVTYADAATTMLTSKGLTLEEVGDILGVTHERIRQIEKNGMRVLTTRFTPVQGRSV